MDDRRTYGKIKKRLDTFTNKVLLKTILYNLSNSDARKFLNLLVAEKFFKAEKLISEKIPDLEERVRTETKKRLKNILHKSE